MQWSSRRTLSPYLEYIPDKDISWNPCLETSRYMQTDVQHFLSCMARKWSIYVVANFGDKQICSSVDPHCPQDGQYQYNTDVVYDPSGNYVTKYHKYNLFYEVQFDKPASCDIITFDTPFGMFGLFTCFDVLFECPSLDLVVHHNVTNIAFPTAWMDAEPFLAAVQFHSAFAAGLGINFLSANIHRPENRFHGSGIYTPGGAVKYYYNSTVGSGGELLVAEVPILNERIPSTDIQAKNLPTAADTPTLQYTTHRFTEYIFHDQFNLVQLTSLNDTVDVCHNRLCCNATYSIMPATDYDNRSVDGQSEYYALGAFDGLHIYQGTYYIQVCTVIRCRGLLSRKCGHIAETPLPNIEMLTMYGNFSTSYIYPEIVLSDNGSPNPASYPNQWSYKNNVMRVPQPFRSPLSVASMFGRVYERD